MYEVINYTITFDCIDGSWLKAFQFSRDACNLALTDELSFIQKYVIDECERMIDNLEEILKNESYQFQKSTRIHTPELEEFSNLIERKGIKISGALQFINSIFKFIEIVDIEEDTVNKYIDRIKQCCIRLKPELLGEIIKLRQKINLLTIQENQLRIIYEPLLLENSTYMTLKNSLQRNLIRNGKLINSPLNKSLLDKYFLEEYPDFKEFSQKFSTVSTEYLLVMEKKSSLNKTMANIINYNNTIGVYLEKQKFK